jgi:hypothetical protein
MTSLLALLLRLVLLGVFTFGFVVLFEHGTKDYVQNVTVDAKKLQAWAEKKAGRTVDEPASPVPTPSAPEPSPVATPQQVPQPSVPPVSAPESSAPPATPDPAAASSGPPAAWQDLQSKPIGGEADSKPSQ